MDEGKKRDKQKKHQEEDQKVIREVRDHVIEELRSLFDERMVVCFFGNDGLAKPVLHDKGFTLGPLKYMSNQGNLPGGEKYNELVKRSGEEPPSREPEYFQIKMFEIGAGEDTRKLLPPEYTLLGVILGASATYNVYLKRVDLSSVESGPAYALTEKGRIESKPI